MIKGKKWRLVKMKKIFSKVVAGALVLCMATLSVSIPSKADCAKYLHSGSGTDGFGGYAVLVYNA